jgi:hypothetical protein
MHLHEQWITYNSKESKQVFEKLFFLNLLQSTSRGALAGVAAVSVVSPVLAIRFKE